MQRQAARAGRHAEIMVRVNALTEHSVIQALYRASQAGVLIRLLVRGSCGLRPGIEGLSETITVRSILGRFLEHSRVYFFHAGGDKKVFCSSADWMYRNLHRRVEVCVPIRDKEIRKRIIDVYSTNCTY